jgi:divalent metal cation (Fe/Co/Zn/Cd) transporter
MPGQWTIQECHDILENVEKDIRELFDSPVTVFTHPEPIGDIVSMHDIGLDRH